MLFGLGTQNGEEVIKESKLFCDSVYLNPILKLNQWYTPYDDQNNCIAIIKLNTVIVTDVLVETVSEVPLPTRNSKIIHDNTLKLNDVHIRND